MPPRDGFLPVRISMNSPPEIDYNAIILIDLERHLERIPHIWVVVEPHARSDLPGQYANQQSPFPPEGREGQAVTSVPGGRLHRPAGADRRLGLAPRATIPFCDIKGTWWPGASARSRRAALAASQPRAADKPMKSHTRSSACALRWLTAFFIVERQLAQRGTCALVAPVFDGLSRYDLRFTNAQSETLSPEGRQRFTGPTNAATSRERTLPASRPIKPRRPIRGARSGMLVWGAIKWCRCGWSSTPNSAAFGVSWRAARGRRRPPVHGLSLDRALRA
jgi:hypothetical protein